MKHWVSSKGSLGFVSFALTVGLCGAALAESPAPGVQGGTYYNTPGSRTTFTNNAGGFWFHSGDQLRGLESTCPGNVTNAGGVLQFHVPGSVVHIDGHIDTVGAIANGQLSQSHGQLFASPGNTSPVFPTHTVQDGRIISGGTYFNTAHQATTFINNNAGGLWLKSDSTVHGLEVGANGGLNHNGGTLHLFAPGQVVRVDAPAFPTNTVQDGRIISGGTYYNTADQATTFMNSNAGGLWLKSASTVRGLEVGANGGLTHNGGTLHLFAPGQVVRVDGTINVNSAMSAQGAALGNGGKVFIDSAYLFQNGNIFANGINGGLVQANVGSMTLGSGAKIEAKGLGGAGGVVAINANGPVDIRRGAVVDTSGRVVGSFDANLISIEGSLVNNDGALRADGVAAQLGGSRGGTIRLVATGQSDIKSIKDSLQAATQNPVGDTSAPTISSQERSFILQRTSAQITNHDGDVALNRDSQNTLPTYSSLLSASATSGQTDANNDYTQNATLRSGDGGTIMLTAMRHVVNQGSLLANGANGQGNAIHGGNGGTIVAMTQGGIINDKGRLEANGGAGGHAQGLGGNGGNGGLITFGYNNALSNSGGLYADGGIGGSAPTPGHGGNGGLVVFSGDANPTGHGSIDVIARPGGNNNLALGGKSGTVVSPNPTTLGQTQVYFQQGYENGQFISHRATEQTHDMELLTHNENLVFLTKNGLNSPSANLFERLLQSNIRSVEDPTGTLGQARTEVVNKNTGSSPYVFRNLMLGSSRDNLALDMSHPWGGAFESHLILPSALSNEQGFTTLNTLNIVNDGSLTTQQFLRPTNDVSSQPIDVWVIGRNSNSLGGGRISLLANGNVSNTNVFGTVGAASGGSVNIATTGSFFGGGNLLETAGSVHGGSILIKAENNIVYNATGLNEGVNLTANGGLLGGTVRLTPKQDFRYQRTDNDSAISANGSLQGGIIEVNAGHDSLMNPAASPGEPPFVTAQHITANGTSPTEGRGGFIRVHAGNANIHNLVIEATGGLQNGTVLFGTGN